MFFNLFLLPGQRLLTLYYIYIHIIWMRRVGNNINNGDRRRRSRHAIRSHVYVYIYIRTNRRTTTRKKERVERLPTKDSTSMTTVQVLFFLLCFWATRATGHTEPPHHLSRRRRLRSLTSSAAENTTLFV